MRVSSLIVAMSALALGCQEAAERGECKPGFVRAQERWCIFDESLFPMQSEEAEEGSEVDGSGAEAGAAGASDASSEDDPESYVYEAEEPGVKLSLPEIERAIEEAILTVRWIDPGKMHDAYDNSESYGDEYCPVYDDEYLEERDQYHWRDACTVGAGGSFSGYAYSNYWGDYTSDNGAYDYAGHAYFRGSARVIDGRGNTFIAAGNSSYYERKHYLNGDGTFSQSMFGNFRSDDPQFYGTWLAEDINVSLTHTSTQYANHADHLGGGFYIYWDASISGLAGEINAIRLSNIYMYSQNEGSMCEIEPSGSISIRDSEGNWYETEFDGPKYFGAAAFPPDCDSCGRVFWRGELLGEICPDFSLLTDWEERPWL
jgi:hypothetical protein